MLRDIDGRSPIARRSRDILRGYEHEFAITTEAERTLARQAATLAVLSEEMQAEMARGEPVVAATMVRLAQPERVVSRQSQGRPTSG